MSMLREEIRAILREELAALRAELGRAEIERVRITSSDELNDFARNLLERATQPGFSERVLNGELRFELEGGGKPAGAAIPAATPRPIVSNPPPSRHSETIEKPLLTEGDIAALSSDTKLLRLSKKTRMTPLAQDEAKRRGIRIERDAQ